MTSLNLYVWEGVLCDYTSGMVVALANSKKEAIETAVEESGLNIGHELRSVRPKVISMKTARRPRAWYVYGGG